MSLEFIILHFAKSIAHSRGHVSVIDFAKCRMMNSDDLLLFAESFENLSFIINSASCKIKVEFYILIGF